MTADIMTTALKAIKMAGFKSIVDPTTFTFKHMKTGVVGPNGCGKSNIIDAIRWVTGESSAKQLRGEALIDVIFNGSSTRKPVSQASVELIFDNENGRLTQGQYGEYQEIALRRTLNRDGQSHYYINNVRCRRRDIIDLLRGTGLGPRNYAIIEQGMISRLVEAKPDELRTFIEEVAGTSQYKDRRRETENRLRATRENLERLLDIQQEIEKQLRHLKRQASAAERYQVYQEELRMLKAEREVLAWRAVKAASADNEKQLAACESGIAEVQAQLAELSRNANEQDQAKHALQDKMQQSQTAFYEAGASISRMEEQLKAMRKAKADAEYQLEAVRTAIAEAKDELDAQNEQAIEAQHGHEQLTALIEEHESTLASSKAAVVAQEAAMSAWQQQWSQFVETSGVAQQTIEIGKSRAQDWSQQRERLQQQRNTCEQGVQAIDLTGHAASVQAMASELDAKQTSLQDVNQRLTAKQSARHQVRQDYQSLQERFHEAKETFASDKARLASLEALQQDAIAQNAERQSAWLAKKGWGHHKRLGDQLVVDPVWERAVETVLGPHLEAVCLDKSSLSYEQMVKEPPACGVILHADRPSDARVAVDTLQSVLKEGTWAAGLLASVYKADDLHAALARLKELAPHESVITPEGVWLSHHWMRFPADDDQHHGVLERQRVMASLQKRIADHGPMIQSLESQMKDALASLEEAEASIQALLDEQQQHQQALAQAQSQHASLLAEETHQRTRLEQLQDEMQQIDASLASLASQLADNIEAQAKAEAVQASDEATRAALQSEREGIQLALDEARLAYQELKSTYDSDLVKQQALENQLHYAKQNSARAQSLLDAKQTEFERLSSHLAEAGAPIDTLHASLTELVAKRVEEEQRLDAIKSELSTFESQLSQDQEARLALEKKMDQLRDQRESCRIHVQTAVVKAQTHEQQIKEYELDCATLHEALDQDALLSNWEEKIAQQNQRISRLGPINLAAIEEHDQLDERKQYYDKQQADLEASLDTLENAIDRIDRETRTVFKDTYDRINENFQTIFPKIFSGDGKAYLEMTESDHLKAGVIVRAQPPGKRNSTIHLLSGGEKALTAIALVFALFEANPAPFCMLDEVDAPLDEVNVGRFCALVESMAKTVQFIIVTHNKVTMQHMDQLNGVTMRESGVTRLVSVDVAQAIELTEQAA